MDSQEQPLGDRDDYVTIRLSPSAKNRAIAKLIVLLGFGLLVSFAYQADITKRREKAENLTLESYTADFVNYKARLLSGTDTPPAFVPVVSILAIAIMIGSYELLVFLVAWILGKVLPSR